MKPVFMTFPSRPGNNGNCLQAAIASLLELRLDEVPDFANDYGDWYDRYVQPWFRDRGYEVLCYPPTHDEDVPVEGPRRHFRWDEATWWPEGWSLVSGSAVPNPRGECAGLAEHACVAYDGKVVHDPLPGGRGLTDICCYWVLTPLAPEPVTP